MNASPLIFAAYDGIQLPLNLPAECLPSGRFSAVISFSPFILPEDSHRPFYYSFECLLLVFIYIFHNN